MLANETLLKDGHKLILKKKKKFTQGGEATDLREEKEEIEKGSL